MSAELLYTLWFESDDYPEKDDTVLARCLDVHEAAKMICADAGVNLSVSEITYGLFRQLTARLCNAKRHIEVVATVRVMDDPETERRIASEMIDVEIVQRHSEFWSGRVSVDSRFDVRLRTIAETRKMQSEDRRMASHLIDELLSQDYTITCCVRWDNPSFQKSRDREGILELLMKSDIAELELDKNGYTSRIELIFGRGGDIIGEYSQDMEYLVRPILSQYASRVKPVADLQDRDEPVPALPSPAESDNGEPAAETDCDEPIGLIRRQQ